MYGVCVNGDSFTFCYLLLDDNSANWAELGGGRMALSIIEKLHTLRVALHILYKQSHRCRIVDKSWKKEFLKGQL